MIVLARNFGQLGNRLLLSAHLIAAAREYGVPFYNPSFAEYAQFFTSTRDDLWCRFPALSASTDEQADAKNARPPSATRRKLTYKAIYLSGKLIRIAKRLGLPGPMIHLGGDDTCDLASDEFRIRAQSRLPLLVSGWGFRSRPLLEKHGAAVRQHFEIIPEHRHRVTQLIRLARERRRFVVGVHIRHGDYAEFENGRYLYEIEQYVAAMQRLRDQLAGDAVFLVCGNTKLHRDDFGDLSVLFGTGHLVEDMYSFAETDFLIGPPSTYTGWASFFGNVPLQFMQTADEEFDLSRVKGFRPNRQAS